MASHLKIDQIEEWLFEKFDFRYNIITNQIERLKYRNPEDKNKGLKDYKAFSEDEITYDLFKQGFKGFAPELKAIMSNRQLIKEYDPFLDYFSEHIPRWDESKPDYIGKLASYVVAEDQEWFEMMFRKMLVRIVATALGHISVNKNCMVFTGGQDAGKTFFFRYLMPKKLESNHFSEDVDFHSKDSLLLLPRCFLINFDEMDKLNKVELGLMKAFISKSQIMIRPPFGKDVITERRRTSFVASTNESDFLRDLTGNVRFLPITIKTINHDRGGANGYAKNVDIDLVWSQAYYLLTETDFDYLLNDEEKGKQAEINNMHIVETPEMQLINSYFKPSNKERLNFGAEFLQTWEVVERLQRYSQNSVKLNANNIGRALAFYGFDRKSERENYKDKKYNVPTKGYWIEETHFANLENFLKND